MNRGAVTGIVLLFVAAAVIIGWRESRRAAPPPAARPPKVAVAPAPPPVAPPPAAPAIRNPLPAEKRALPPLDQSDDFVKEGLVSLLGHKAVASFLHLEGAARRFVATLNNLATDQASATLWPVNPTPGRFETEPQDGGLVISPRNAERYAPFVRFASTIDAPRAVALYRRLYPLLQSAYEDLGAPGKYLNDRVVDVIDNLLATPKVTGPIRVKRVGSDAGAGTGLYLYEDAALESATAGQKILLRMGPENAAKLTAKLTELRALVASAPRR